MHHENVKMERRECFKRTENYAELGRARQLYCVSTKGIDRCICTIGPILESNHFHQWKMCTTMGKFSFKTHSNSNERGFISLSCPIGKEMDDSHHFVPRSIERLILVRTGKPESQLLITSTIGSRIRQESTTFDSHLRTWLHDDLIISDSLNEIKNTKASAQVWTYFYRSRHGFKPIAVFAFWFWREWLAKSVSQLDNEGEIFSGPSSTFFLITKSEWTGYLASEMGLSELGVCQNNPWKQATY